jgi:hypothetical protein
LGNDCDRVWLNQFVSSNKRIIKKLDEIAYVEIVRANGGVEPVKIKHIVETFEDGSFGITELINSLCIEN